MGFMATIKAQQAIARTEKAIWNRQRSSMRKLLTRG